MASPRYAFALPPRETQTVVFADPAKLRIIQVAESLFAQRSIHDVSLREIAERSGNGNNNAVKYHFGSRDSLIQAIFAWRVWQMEPIRGQGFAKAEAEDALSDIPTLLSLVCMPYLDLVDDTGRHTYAAFMAQYLLNERPAGIRHVADSRPDLAHNLGRILDRLYDLVGATSREEGDYRIALANLLFCNMLVLSDNEGLPRSDPSLFDRHVATGLAMAAAALTAGIC